MEKVNLELMTPGEMRKAQNAAPIAYVPLGPIEWHGPHIPLGTDGMHARHVATEVAKQLGGVVYPTLYAGTETVRVPGDGPEALGSLGLPDDARVIGMDFPGNPVKSIYFEESAFGLTVREVVRGLKSNDFRLVVVVNGHGATNHQQTLRRIAAEENDPATRVLYTTAFLMRSPEDDPGHATRTETSVVLSFAGEHSRLELLPPPGTPLRYQDHGVVDGNAFAGRPADGFVVPEADDPRGATAEEGRQILGEEVRAVTEQVAAALRELGDVSTRG